MATSLDSQNVFLFFLREGGVVGCDRQYMHDLNGILTSMSFFKKASRV